MAEPSQPTDRRSWQGQRVRPGKPTGDRQARLRKIYIIAAIMLVLAGAIAALVFYIRGTPDPTLVVLRIDQYDPRVLVSPCSTTDREDLRKLGLPEKNTFTSQNIDVLRQELGNLGANQPKDQPLIIYLGAYAAVKEDGTVALLPANAKLDDEKTWLPIAEVMEALHKCRVERRLVLLDLAIPCVEPRVGILSANVPERLHPVLDKAVEDDHNLQILAACQPGQQSYWSEELGHTVFAYYLIHGLAGQADGFPNGTPDTRITVSELSNYVTIKVDRWVFANTGRRQTPKLYSHQGTTDYEITGTGGKKKPPSATLSEDYPDTLLDGWKKRDRWLNARNTRTPWKLTLELEQMILRADERWRKGEETSKVDVDLRSAINKIQDRREKVVGSDDDAESKEVPDLSKLPSLAAAEFVAPGKKPPAGSLEDTLRKLKELGTLWRRVRQPKPNEKPADAEIMQLDKKKEDLLKKFEDKPHVLAWHIFEAALTDPDPRPEDFGAWCELLRPESKPLPLYEEIRYLQKLANMEAAKPEDWARNASDGLRLIEVAARVETLKPEREEWLSAEYGDARKLREQAELLLFKKPPAERATLAQPLRDAQRAYADLYKHLTMLRDARRTRDEAMVMLPGYTPYLEHLEYEPLRTSIWLNAVKEARELNDTLSKTPEAKDAVDQIQKADLQASTLRNYLNKLTEPVRIAIGPTAIGNNRKPRSTDVMEMRALLRLPCLTEGQRSVIWKRARDWAKALNDDAQNDTATEKPQDPDEKRAIRQERDRALKRAEVSEALLHLAGSADEDKVKTARIAVDKKPEEMTLWDTLRRELRDAWRRQDAKDRP
jgi:hypothetical protein